MQHLYEDKKQSLINKSKASEKGKKRFDRRNKSKVANTVKSFNSIDMNKLYYLTTDVNDIIKSKFAAMGDETIYKATDSLMLKDGEDKTAYIDNLLEMLNTIKHSKGEELSRLRNAILPLNLEQLRYEFENKTISDINDWVRHLLVYDKMYVREVNI